MSKYECILFSINQCVLSAHDGATNSDQVSKPGASRAGSKSRDSMMTPYPDTVSVQVCDDNATKA